MDKQVFVMPSKEVAVDSSLVNRASEIVLKEMVDVKGTSNEIDMHNIMLSRCASGDSDARKSVTSLIKKIIERDYSLAVPPLSDELARQIYVDNYGLGAIDELVYDKSLNEIWVNGFNHIWVEKAGLKTRINKQFKDNEDVLRVIRLLLHFDRKDITTQEPMVESRLLDGSRITVLIPPVAKHPYINIRKFESFNLSTESLLKEESLTAEMYQWLKLAVKGRANILIIGETSSGKTTLLKWMTTFMDNRLRLGVIETNFELKLDEKYPERNMFSYEERPEIGITMSDIFKKCLRSSPDIIICGEARGPEADELIRAMRRGHPGSVGTIHTNSPETAIDDLAEMINEDGKRRDPLYLRYRIASAIDFIVQMHRIEETGKRKITRISEVVTNSVNENYGISNIFTYSHQEGFVKTGNVTEKLREKLAYFNPSGQYSNAF